MKDYNETVKVIRRLTELDGKTLYERAGKLSEEQGEVWQAMLSACNASGCEYKTQTHEDTAEECVDVIIVAMSILHHLQVEDAKVLELFDHKTAKWLAVVTR